MTTTANTSKLDVPGATVVYDVHGPLPPADGRPVLLMIGSPMDATGFGTLVSLVPDRTVVTYDPRGLGRSTRDDGRTDHTPQQQADDLHALVAVLGAGPVDVLASSGGAVTGLALVTTHAGDVRTLVAHEPPLLMLLPDAELALAAEQRTTDTYHRSGWNAGMAEFIAMTSWRGEFTEEYLAQPPADPSAFGLPTQDDGSRDDPLLSGASVALTAYRPDVEALRSTTARVVVAVGAETGDTSTGRTTAALAEALGQPAVVFPGNHGGFLGDEYGMRGEPEAFAVRLREVLDAPAD